MTFSVYGLVVGIAFIAVIWLADYLLHKSKYLSSRQTLFSPSFLILIGGGAVIGGRAYHLLTDGMQYIGQPWWEWLAIWHGGLGIWGAVGGAIIGLALYKKWQAVPISWPVILDVLALVLPWGQTLGRWGNFFNQELFGPPTNLPWGIYISLPHRPLSWQQFSTFHPLFLYEMLGTVFIAINLWWLRKQALTINRDWPLLQIGGGLYASLYGLGYGLLRFFLEYGRWDAARWWGGLTAGQWLSLVLVISALFYMNFCVNRTFRYHRNHHSQPQRLAIALFFVGILLIGPSHARAQEQTPLDLSISPSVVEIRVQPGKSVTQAFLIENAGTNDLEATATLRDFTADNYSGHPQLKDTSSFPYASIQNANIQLNQPFVLPANSSQQLVLSIQPPADSATQDWYEVLLVTTKPRQELATTNSGGTTRGNIAANLIIAVSPTDTIPHTWQLAFRQLPRIMDSLQALTIHPVVTNTAATYGIPDLKVLVLNQQHKIVYDAAGLPDRVLANSAREISAAVTRQSDPRSLDPAPFTWRPLLAIGRYTIRGSIRNQANQPLVVEQTIWAFPFVLVGSSLILVLALLSLFIWRRRHPFTRQTGV